MFCQHFYNLPLHVLNDKTGTGFISIYNFFFFFFCPLKIFQLLEYFHSPILTLKIFYCKHLIVLNLVNTKLFAHTGCVFRMLTKTCLQGESSFLRRPKMESSGETFQDESRINYQYARKWFKIYHIILQMKSEIHHQSNKK